MKINLLVVYGKTTKRKLVPRLPAVLGRGREADIKVVHPLISRRHCELYENDGLLMLRDLTSLNGTMIESRRIELAPLLPGAEFTIGPLTFQVLYSYNGDPDLVPDVRYVPEGEGAVIAGFENPLATATQDPTFDPESPWSDVSADDSLSGEMAIPDLIALADAEVEEVFPEPAPSAPAAPRSPSRPAVPNLPQAAVRPPVAAIEDFEGELIELDEPLEVESSLQSGGHITESPWAVEAEILEELSAPEIPPTAHSPTVHPPKRHTVVEDEDAEFGNFLEGLQ